MNFCHLKLFSLKKIKQKKNIFTKNNLFPADNFCHPNFCINKISSHLDFFYQKLDTELRNIKCDDLKIKKVFID